MNVVALKIERTPYTYILEWTRLNKRYIGARWAIGCHPDDLWKEYFTSSAYVNEFVVNNGAPDLILIDQVFSSPKGAIEREYELLKQFGVPFNKDFLNKCIGGGFDGQDPEVRKRQAAAQRGKKMSEAAKLKVILFQTGRIKTPEECANISRALRGKPKSPEHAEKCRIAAIGNVVSDKEREKRSRRTSGKPNLSWKGKKHTDHSKWLMSQHRSGINNYWFGKKQDLASCLYCKASGGVMTMARWHFDNCSMKPIKVAA